MKLSVETTAQPCTKVVHAFVDRGASEVSQAGLDRMQDSPVGHSEMPSIRVVLRPQALSLEVTRPGMTEMSFGSLSARESDRLGKRRQTVQLRKIQR